MLRHLHSLRLMRLAQLVGFDRDCKLTLASTLSRDGGWIRTLLEEAENERMHLLTFMKVGAFFYISRRIQLTTSLFAA